MSDDRDQQTANNAVDPAPTEEAKPADVNPTVPSAEAVEPLLATEPGTNDPAAAPDAAAPSDDPAAAPDAAAPSDEPAAAPVPADEPAPVAEAPVVAEEPAAPDKPAASEEPASAEELMDMDALMASYDAAEPPRDLRRGSLVTGVVVLINESGAMVDVGAKSEGLIPRSELDDATSLKVGDSVRVVVADVEGEDVILSKRQADSERAWEDLAERSTKDEVLMDGLVVEAVKGGLLVDIGEFGTGFVPASHISAQRPRNMDQLVGQRLQLQVLEVEVRRHRVVLSRRLAAEREREGEREETLSDLREGQVRLGRVRRLAEFGAFVDVGGVDGLLHSTELSWQRVNIPREQLRVDEEIEVMVLRVQSDGDRISLGRRQLMADPWRDIPRMYREGQTVRGTVRAISTDCCHALIDLPVGWVVETEVPEELRPSSGAATPAEAAPEASAEAAAPAEPEAPAAEAVVPEAEQAADPAASETSAPAADAASDAESKPSLAPGLEVELCIERMVPSERELLVSFAATRPVAERGRGRLADTDSYQAPSAPGRYSDRREDRDDDEEGGRRAARDRRDRRRPREGDRERENITPDQLTTGPVRRTLGDLMGDRLRSLLGGGREDSAGTDEDSQKE